MKDRDTNQVRTEVVQATNGPTLRGFVGRDVQTEAMAYTDEAPAYRGLPALFYRHESVQHSVSEHVRDMAHTNGMESVWSLLKRGYTGLLQDQLEALGAVCGGVSAGGTTSGAPTCWPGWAVW